MNRICLLLSENEPLFCKKSYNARFVQRNVFSYVIISIHLEVTFSVFSTSKQRFVLLVDLEEILAV